MSQVPKQLTRKYLITRLRCNRKELHEPNDLREEKGKSMKGDRIQIQDFKLISEHRGNAF